MGCPQDASKQTCRITEMASIREEADRLSRILNDRFRKQEIHGGFRDGSVVINGANFMADDVLAIMREALNHRLGNPAADGAVSLDRHNCPFFTIERFDDFRVHGFSANHVQRIGQMMARAWQQYLTESGLTYHEVAEAPAIGARFTAAGLGEFKASLALCREIAIVRACHAGATIYPHAQESLARERRDELRSHVIHRFMEPERPGSQYAAPRA
jgi:hypothetical protein